MTKFELLLVALASGGKHEHTPVQVQKLMFLIEKNVGKQIGGGSHFEFTPYDYGPFDPSIYELLRQMEAEQLAVSSMTNRGWKKYSLTDAGLERAASSSSQLNLTVSSYINKVSEFVRTLSFSDLVSAVYKAYPEMRVNSVFKIEQ
jgi:uncharacterized protein